MCLVRLLDVEEALPHVEYLNGRSPLCTRMCTDVEHFTVQPGASGLVSADARLKQPKTASAENSTAPPLHPSQMFEPLHRTLAIGVESRAETNLCSVLHDHSTAINCFTPRNQG
jgi:hypothetical protein